ncbi:hypothetical protein GHT06_021817 [Daphnia sinensis]|uniref:NADH dehydrogenase [ubiquinone] iron-sulfur protein 5 n=1 Tax=Daphnia sinensis TaxID=1820382 RepID=A0AAD5KGN8_9CRUS|nr:hypothetical protein GHT06_021817 [Daphnia sinensis]
MATARNFRLASRLRFGIPEKNFLLSKMANLTEPILRTRFTDMSAALFSAQKTECKDFELRYVYCLEAYGKSLGESKCKDLKDDIQECFFKFKQLARTEAIKNERVRQLKSGELKPEETYGPIPKPDSF